MEAIFNRSIILQVRSVTVASHQASLPHAQRVHSCVAPEVALLTLKVPGCITSVETVIREHVCARVHYR
jgi:hypothetical protein